MPYAKMTTIGALALAIASATGCSRETPPAEDTSINEAAEREADRVAELQRERADEVARMDERVANLERDYNEEAAAQPRGTSGGAARNVRDELKEDVTNVREAVDDLRTTTAENWWERHERALKRSADDIEEDVRAFAGARAIPAAPRDDRAIEAPSTVGGDPAPFTSTRDAFVTALRVRVDAMDKALSGVKARGARETELEDLRARLDKLGEDVDELRSASAEDWWNITKQRVAEYIDRVEGSVARVDDLPSR
jgi:hypothetical protein